MVGRASGAAETPHIGGLHRMDSITLLRQQLKTQHGYMERTMANVTPEMAHAVPPGHANPLGATYAHIPFSEDAIVNGMLRQQAPMAMSSWAGRTGTSEPMPLPNGNWEDYGPW